MTCQEANDAQFEQQLTDCNDIDLLKAMLRMQRKDLLQALTNAQSAIGAAKLNQETIGNMQREKNRG